MSYQKTKQQQPQPPQPQQNQLDHKNGNSSNKLTTERSIQLQNQEARFVVECFDCGFGFTKTTMDPCVCPIPSCGSMCVLKKRPTGSFVRHKTS